MSTLAATLLSEVIFDSLGFLGRDFFLLPVKTGDNEGCESLQNKVDALKKKMGVTIPITVVENSWMPWAAHGSVVYGKGGITVPSTEIAECSKESEDTQIAILAHEISHLKHNDGAWLFVIALVTAVASIIFMWSVFPIALLPYVEYLAVIPTLAALCIRSVYQERAADMEACKYMTDAQKRAMIAWFEKMQQKKIAYRNEKGLSWLTQLWRQFMVDSEGNSLLGRLTHPPLTERIQYFREQIHDKQKKKHEDDLRFYAHG